MRSYFRCFTTITRLINHSIDPSRFNQSIDRSQSINILIDRSKERSLNRSITRSVLIDHSDFRSVNHSINQLIDLRSISLSIDREIDRDRAINQSIKQSINLSILCSIISSRADTDVSSVSFDFFQNLGADATDPYDTTRTATVIYAYDANCYGYNG